MFRRVLLLSIMLLGGASPSAAGPLGDLVGALADYSGATSDEASVATALGDLVGDALTKLSEEEESRPAKPKVKVTQAPEPKRMPCRNGYCYPAGHPGKFASGSREQLAALCSVIDQRTGKLALSEFRNSQICVRSLWTAATMRADNMAASNFGPQ